VGRADRRALGPGEAVGDLQGAEAVELFPDVGAAECPRRGFFSAERVGDFLVLCKYMAGISGGGRSEHVGVGNYRGHFSMPINKITAT